MACLVIDGDGESYSVILEYAPKINRVGTSSLGPIESLVALKNVSSAKSSSMLGILVVIIK